ncbi:sterol O-acyltransferase 1-like [Musca autumnalis]|uniref:sterol O-acyltransferase 1-like n=1 Tax=Musca autumnalis TaxID=221902 RepID=UPI003CF1CB37
MHQPESKNEEMETVIKVKDPDDTVLSQPQNESTVNKETNTYKRNDISSNKLSKKVFRSQESMFIELMEIGHVETVYNLFIAMFILYLSYNILDDYFVKGRITLASETFHKGFKNIYYAFVMWLILQLYTFGIYYPLKLWANIRNKLQHHEYLQLAWSAFWLLTYIISIGLFFYITAKVCLVYDIRYASSLALLLDATRLLMKQHAFVRVSCARVLSSGKTFAETIENVEKPNGKQTLDNNGDYLGIPPFRKYLYYLFAPTLLYRDNYPRTTHIRWKFVALRFMECLAFVFLFAIVFENQLRPILIDFGEKKITPELIVRTYFAILPPVVLMLLSFVFFLLHSWNNLTAELLKFADRRFHGDWWTSTNYFQFFRRWNTVVGDWLYEYIFRDFYMHINPSKAAATFALYIVSAIVHEYIISISLRLLFPVMTFLYIVGGMILVHVTTWIPKNIGNLNFCLCFLIGVTLSFGSYPIEYYAKENCPKEQYTSWSDLLIPHMWACRN